MPLFTTLPNLNTMKAYLLSVLILDFDELGEEVKDVLEQTYYPNDCINPKVIDLKEIDVGEWHDGHPLNKEMENSEIKKLFE